MSHLITASSSYAFDYNTSNYWLFHAVLQEVNARTTTLAVILYARYPRKTILSSPVASATTRPCSDLIRMI